MDQHLGMDKADGLYAGERLETMRFLLKVNGVGHAPCSRPYFVFEAHLRPIQWAMHFAALDQTACIATTCCVFLDCVFIIDFHRCQSPPGICCVAITVLHVTVRCTYFVYTPVHDAQIHDLSTSPLR